MRIPDSRRPNPAGPIVLGAAYVCMLAFVVNIAARLGWVRFRLPFLTGFPARWIWALGAVVCFVIAWYIERDSSRRTPRGPRFR